MSSKRQRIIDNVKCYKEVKKEKGCQAEVNLSSWCLLEEQFQEGIGGRSLRQ